MMAIFPDGTRAGTVGGGGVEFEAQALALQLLERRENHSRSYRFVQGESAVPGEVCGGDVTLHFQYLPADSPKNLAVFRELSRAGSEYAEMWFVRRLEGDGVTAMGTASREGLRHCQVPSGGVAPLLQGQSVLTPEGWLSIPVGRAGYVYVFGGGHVAQALVPAAARAGFRPVVYDDRPDFAVPALFPDAQRLICGDFEDLPRRVSVTPADYVVIMSHGHESDYQILTQVLRSGARYIGCLGSRQKLALCRERLLSDGFTPEEFGRLHAPIGLAIGAETPEEIAVSITAELIAVRSGALA